MSVERILALALNFSSFQRRRKVRVGLDHESAELVISPLIGPLRSPGGGGREE